MQGDTDRSTTGGGTGGSRSIPLGGVSAARAGEDLAEKIKALAADELEAGGGRHRARRRHGPHRRHRPRRSALRRLPRRAKSRADAATASATSSQDEATYPNGTHICEVEIDPETGATEIVNYTIVDDFGVTVNPILLAGQIHGGVVQGIGQALTEARSTTTTAS